MTLEWDPNPEPDIAGYIIYLGTASGQYDREIEVETGTVGTVDDLEEGTTYFSVVTAKNTAGLESLPSDEISFQATPNASVGFTGLDDGGFLNWQRAFSLSIQSSGSVARIEVMEGSRSVGEIAGGSGAIAWEGAAAGAHTLTARAYDASGRLLKETAITVEVVQPKIENLRLRPDRCAEFTVIGAPGKPQQIQFSSDLLTWEAGETIINATGEMTYVDVESASVLHRFYRVRSE